MSGLQGQILINDTPTKHKLARFIEKKITKWAQNQNMASPATYNVSFTEEDGTRQISCTTEIHFGNHVWKGWDLAADTQSAFMQSLKRLHPN